MPSFAELHPSKPVDFTGLGRLQLSLGRYSLSLKIHYLIMWPTRTLPSPVLDTSQMAPDDFVGSVGQFNVHVTVGTVPPIALLGKSYL